MLPLFSENENENPGVLPLLVVIEEEVGILYSVYVSFVMRSCENQRYCLFQFLLELFVFQIMRNNHLTMIQMSLTKIFSTVLFDYRGHPTKKNMTGHHLALIFII